MTITELGAIGELVGGAAVLVTLVYLALQVNQSNAIERERANREVTRDGNQIYMAMREPEFMRIMRRASVDFESLTNNERSLVTFRYLAPMVAHATSAFLAKREGLVAKSYADRWILNWVSVIRSPGFEVWWEVERHYFEPDFVREVERIRAAPGGPPPLHDGVPWLALDEHDLEAA